MMRFILLLLLLRETLSQCPPGYSTLFSNNQLVSCSPQNPCSCASISAGYFCQYSSQNNQYVCCGAASSQCPSSSAQLNNGVVQNCQSSSDCGSGYYCNQNTCCASPSAQCGGGGGTQCASGQVLVNGVCQSQVSIGSYCQSSLVCTGGAQCTNNYCQCSSGQQNINGQCQGSGNNGQCQLGSVLVNNQCVLQVSPGQSCSTTQQCLDNSVCNGVCSCQNNLQQINGYCVPASTGSCQASQVLINGICQTFSTLNGPCVGNSQCVGGTVCQNSICQCPSNTQSLTVTSNSIQRGYCLSNNNNNNNFCQSGQVYVNGQCMQQIQLGSFGCTYSQQCLGNSQCTNGQCQCPQGSTQQNGQCFTGNGQCSINQIYVNGQCMQQIQLGSSGCSYSQQCLGNSQCFNGMCQCAQGTTQQNGQCITGNGQCGTNQVYVNGQCMQQIQLGSYGCTFSQQCMGNSQCLNGMCQCPQGSTQQNGQCITGNGQCGTNQIYVNGQCMQQIQLGSSGCSYSQQCLGNSQCTNGQCQCPQGSTQQNGQCLTGNGQCGTNQVYVNGQCMQQIQLGSYGCSYSQQCLGNSQCLNGMCQCAQGTTQQNGQCLTNNGQCGANQVYVNGQCMQQIQLGSYGCSYSQQCVGSSQCTNGMCQCPSGSTQQNGQCIQGGGGMACQLGSVLVNGVCTQQVTPGSQCFSNSQCLDNAICNFNTCACQNNGQSISGYCMPQSSGFCSTTQTYINGQCVTYSTVGGSCLADQQCLGGSNCLNGACACTQNKQRFCLAQNGFQSCYCLSSSTGTNCQSGQILVNGQCMQQIQLGSFGCSYSQQCLGNSQCLNGMCQCAQGTTQQNGQCITSGSTSQSPPGTFCSSSSQCLDNSVCSFSNCTCQNGGQALYGYCLPAKADFCSNTQIMIGSQCLTYSVIGGSCQGDKQCLGGSFCSNGFCACRQGVQQTCVGSNQCYCQGGSGSIPIGGFGCTTAQQCLGNAQCFSGQCQCGQGTTQQNGQCVSNQCGFGQVLVNGQCVNQIQIGGYGCASSQQCAGNAQCFNGYCQCAQGTFQQGNQCVSSGGNNCQSYQVQFNGQCLDSVSIGQQCTNQIQCTPTSNTICSGTCTCSSGFSYNGTACTMSSTFCPQGTVSVSNTCRSLVALGQFCQSTAQCIGFGTCNSNSFCACPTGTTNINNICRSSNSGQCGANQVLIGNQCYPTVPLGQSCMASQQCQGSGTCINSVCVCPSGTTNYGNGVCTGASSDSDLCSAGETPQYSNNQLINCLASACPSSSYCKYNSRYSKYVCCRPQSSTLTCANPAYSVVYQNGSPLNCLLSICPTNSICEYNNSSGQYVCCQSGSGSGSPSTTCTGNYYTYSNGFPFVCTSDSACTQSSTSYRYCRQAPGQTFSVCCDRF